MLCLWARNAEGLWLYEAVGFWHVLPSGLPEMKYERANVFMKKNL